MTSSSSSGNPTAITSSPSPPRSFAEEELCALHHVALHSILMSGHATLSDSDWANRVNSHLESRRTSTRRGEQEPTTKEGKGGEEQEPQKQLTAADIPELAEALQAYHGCVLHPNILSERRGQHKKGAPEKEEGEEGSSSSSLFWVIHPFSLAPTNCWVQCSPQAAETLGLSGSSQESGANSEQAAEWWGNCAWCGLGVVGALLGKYNREAAQKKKKIEPDDPSCLFATIMSNIGGEHKKQLTIEISFAGEITRILTTTMSTTASAISTPPTSRQEEVPELYVHFPVPMVNAWDNVVYTCSVMLFFTGDGQDVDSWCQRHGIQRGDVQPVKRVVWPFAREWYGKHLDAEWRKISLSDAAAMFARHGLGDSSRAEGRQIWDLPGVTAEQGGKF